MWLIIYREESRDSRKAMIDKVPMLNIHQTSLAPNRFTEKMKIEASDDTKEPECLHPTLVAPSDAKNQNNYIDLNDENGK